MKKQKRKLRSKPCQFCNTGKRKNPGVCKPCAGSGQVRIINGRNKGSTFERNVAKEVSNWTGILFTRSPSSGGWNQTGDITPKNPQHMVDFPFNLELKNQEILQFSHIFQVPKNKKTPIRKWWKQAYLDAIKSGKIPVLVFTKSHEEVFCMVQRSTFNRLQIHRTARVQVHIGNHIVFLWRDFLAVPYLKMVERLK